MSEVEIVLLFKIALFLIVAISAIFVGTKNADAQANILASTPTGTTFCSTNAAQVSVDMSNCTDGMAIPVGTTGQRPSSAWGGVFRYNTDISAVEVYTPSTFSWATVGPQVQSNWSQSSNTSPTYIQNKPTDLGSFTNAPGYLTIGSSSISALFTPYLTISSAGTTYLTQTNAASTYLTQSNAASTYATQSSLASGLATKQATITLGTSGQYMNGLLSPVNFPTYTISAPTITVPARSLNTPFQISTTNTGYGSYSISTSCTAALLAGQNSTVTIEYADNSGMTTNLKVPNQNTNSASGVLNLATQGPGSVYSWIPAGKWVDIVTSTTGTACPVAIGTAQQEVVFPF